MAKQFEAMLENAKMALELLTAADQWASELINQNVLDFHQASAISRVFYHPLEGTRELIAYLKQGVTQEPPRAIIDRGQLVKVIADTYQKYFIDREVTAGVPFIVYESGTGRVIGQPSALPLRDGDQLITKLSPGCFGDNVDNGAEIEYLLTEISPEWVDDMIGNID